MSFKKLLNDEINESPVGQIGRTTSTDADEFIENNPQVLEQFRKIVQKMGGKTVARRILDRMSNNQTIRKSISEATEKVDDYLRDVGFKIKKVIPSRNGGYSIEFYRDEHAIEAYEDLKSAGFQEEYDLSYIEGETYIMVKEI